MEVKKMSSLLDKYFTKKLKKCINKLLIKWYIDFKYIENNKYVRLAIKKKIYNDDQYEVIFSFFKDDAFIILCSQKELEEYIKNQVEGYFDSLK